MPGQITGSWQGSLKEKEGGKKKGLKTGCFKAKKKSLAATYSPTLLCAVPSAMKGLTSEFGMGSGISLSLMPPNENHKRFKFHLSKSALENNLTRLIFYFAPHCLC